MCGSYPYRTLLVMVAFLFALSLSKAQPPNWDSVYTHYLQKYQPTDTPAWVFPMVFEERTGQRDTIYIGYDKTADSLICCDSGGFYYIKRDTNFGESFIKYDTSEFNVSFYLRDSTKLPVLIADSFNLLEGNMIEFHNGKTPVKMYWDSRRFFSDSLPFREVSPCPRARGELWCSALIGGYKPCIPDHPSAIFADTAACEYTGWDMWGVIVKDSLLFEGPDTTAPSEVFQIDKFVIKPYKSTTGIGKSYQVKNGVTLSPNPFSRYLRMVNHHLKPLTYRIYNINSQVVKSGRLGGRKQRQMSFTDLPPGIYLYRYNYRDRNETHLEKVIKIH